MISKDFAVDVVAEAVTAVGVDNFGIWRTDAITIAVVVGKTKLLFESVATQSNDPNPLAPPQFVVWVRVRLAYKECPELFGDTTSTRTPVPEHPLVIVQKSPFGAEAPRYEFSDPPSVTRFGAT